MSSIKIEWLSDTHDCETCGASWAEGARVTIDGEVLEFIPIAHCYDGTNYSEREIYTAILRHLGHTVDGGEE